jgi:hypothetical protein
MGAERVASTRSIIEVLDHVIDKGIVVDAWVRLSASGIDLLAHRVRIVVASIATSLTDNSRPNDDVRPRSRKTKS